MSRTEFVHIERPRWVIADTHLGHEKILEYCPGRRRWSTSILEHDAHLIQRWTDLVAPQDVVLHLGDFGPSDVDAVAAYRAWLPGRIILVRGNHDPSAEKLTACGFDLVLSAAVFTTASGRTVRCRHNPAAFHPRDLADDALLLHGHTHGHHPGANVNAVVRDRLRDVSLDALGSDAPIALDELLARA